MRTLKSVFAVSTLMAIAAGAEPSLSKDLKPAASGTSASAKAAPAAPQSAQPEPAADATDEESGSKAEVNAAAAPKSWSPDEIATANARCSVILKRIQAIAILHTPIREGECGAPAPIELVSIGKNPEVAISPPAILTCEMAEALYTWVKNDLQALANEHLSGEIIRIETMSDYSCRSAYGRAGHKLSEHAHANALDIRGFVTANAKTAYVLEGWGKPQREINAEIAAAKAAAEKAAAAKAAADRAA